VGAQHDPAWVHIVTTQPVVKTGLVAMLQTAPTPLAITTSAPVLADRDFAQPDVVLFDVILMQEGDTTDLDTWVKETTTTVIAIDRTLRPDLVPKHEPTASNGASRSQSRPRNSSRWSTRR
jgi:hypothetical protein